ncbi:MAG TPA: YetF domain-containing protein [Methylophilaceae bacterium]|nr:YetF domain-containing protein [Methylophilaceae bacterium]
MFNMTVPWWELVARGVVVYAFLILLLRVTGKRQIGQLSPFDLVLLLILSNAVQNSMNAGDNSLVGGLISAFTLVAVNYLVGLVTFKSKKLEEIIEGRPQLIIHEGKLFEDVMNDAKLTRHELDSTLRQSGYFEIKDVKLAILETNGTVSVQGYEKK